MEPKLLRGRDVAAILNISRALAYRLMATGAIPSVRFGRTVRVHPEDLERFISENSFNAYMGIEQGEGQRVWLPVNSIQHAQGSRERIECLLAEAANPAPKKSVRFSKLEKTAVE